MKPSIYHRIRRRPASRDIAAPKKDNQQEQQFFGDTMHEPFFKPAASSQSNVAVQRKCADCEGEDNVQRSPDKKEEEKVQKKEDKKDEEKKVQRAADKKEEEKVQKKEDKKEEKVMKKEDKKEEEKVQKKETASATANTSAIASNYIGSINGKGQSMNAGVQSFYERSIGADFSNVKIHTGKEAAESAKDINAQAYAYGNHIVFNEGKYQPETNEGKHLLAHELVHVVQQGLSVKIQRQRGYRPPPVRPQPVPSRGRFGQRDGQRLPQRQRPLPKEAFERREREKAEVAHRQFMEAVKRNQKWLERWGREGSEPKTAAQKAFYVLVKVLEIWDEVSNSWDEAHKKFERILNERLTNTSVEFSEDFDRQLIEAAIRLKNFDEEMFTRLYAWQKRRDKWIEWYERVHITPSNAIDLAYELIELVLEGVSMGQDLTEKIRKIYNRIPLSYSHLVNPYKGQTVKE